MSPLTATRLAGVATVRARDGRLLTFRCDPAADCVRVTDTAGRDCGTIGGPGAGALRAPLDITVVRPPLAGPRLALLAADTVWLAVADYGHRRIQVFDVDGTHVAAIDVADEPGLGAPCGVSWRAPVLDVEGLDGTRVRLYLGAALLASREQDARPARPARTLAPAREAVN